MNLVRLQYGGGSSIEPYTVIVSLDEKFKGQPVTLTQGTEIMRKTCPTTAPYEVEFKPMNDGVWVASSTTKDGKVVSVDTEPLLEWRTYRVELKSGIDFVEWLTRGRVEETFESLDKVLESEKTIRQLMTVHDSVDYLVTALANDEVTANKILNNDLCAKWINLRDYALDKLEANATVKAVMDSVDKYGYGEWALINGTWQPKGAVPVMTADNAPYGTASADASLSDYNAFKAFNNVLGDVSGDNNRWAGNNGAFGNTMALKYEFANPISIKMLDIQCVLNGDKEKALDATWHIETSKDGVNWENLLTKAQTAEENSTLKTYKVSSDYCKFVRFWTETAISKGGANDYYAQCRTLQFYGRELKISVPKSVNDYIPYGEIMVDHESGGTNYRKEKSFDGLTSTFWYTYGSDTVNGRTMNDVLKFVGYKFPQKIQNVIAYFTFSVPDNMAEIFNATFSLEYSNDGETWHEATSKEIINQGKLDYYYSLEAPTNIEANYWRISTLKGNGIGFLDNSPGYYMSTSIVKIYGKDCTERDFSQDNNIDYIYDNGVELVSITKGLETTKEASSIYTNAVFKAPAGAYGMYTTEKINIGHKILRAVLGGRLTGNSSNSYIFAGFGTNNDIPPTIGGLGNYSNLTTPIDPFSVGLNIENIKGDYSLFLAYIHNGVGTMSAEFDLKELWLEK